MTDGLKSTTQNPTTSDCETPPLVAVMVLVLVTTTEAKTLAGLLEALLYRTPSGIATELAVVMEVPSVAVLLLTPLARVIVPYWTLAIAVETNSMIVPLTVTVSVTSEELRVAVTTVPLVSAVEAK